MIIKIRNKNSSLPDTVNEATDQKWLEMQKCYLAMIDHELRTPLSIIDLGVQSLQILDDKAPQERVTRYDSLHKAVNRMTNALNLAEEVKYASENDTWPNLKTIDLKKLSFEIIENLSIGNQARVSIHCQEYPATTQGNHTAIKLALINLVENALKYSPQERPVNVYIFSRGQSWLWQIVDFGEGVPEHQIDKIFEYKYRGENSQNKSGKGLGLYLAKTLLESMNSSITYHLKDGVNSCFECRFKVFNG